MADNNSIIDQLLKEIAKEKGFVDYDTEIGDGSKRGDGYVGLTSSVRIISKNENKPKTLSLFVKKASENEDLRKLSNMEFMFRREIFMYKTIFPMFKDLELKSGLEPSSFAPIMYGSSSDSKRECIILENLKENGYKLHECSIPMNDDHVSLVIGQYGRVHALSYALKSKDPQTFSKLSENLDSYAIKFAKEQGFLTNTFVDKCAKLYDSLSKLKYDEKVLEVYKSFVGTIEDEYLNFATAIDSYAAIIHGDCWTNNMMFKYETEDNTSKPTYVRFYDYQISRIGSPVLDIAYFFYCCSSKEVINNWKHYLQLYHKSLSSHLRKLGGNVDELFPYEVLEDHWRKYARCGFMFASLVIFIMFTKQEETIDFEKEAHGKDDISNVFDYEISKHDKYLDRMGHLVLHFVNNNLFESY